MQENSSIRKLRLISKFKKSSTGKLIITINILPNISRSKLNQTMKLGQVIEYNGRNIFLQYTKCGGETSHRNFSKKSKLRISLHQPSEILYSFLLLYAQVEDYQNMLNLRCGQLTLILQNFFKKQKQVIWNWAPWLIFCIIFEGEYSLSYIL